MAETFARVWFLCAIAFLAGSAVTWLLFVRGRPQHRSHPLFRPAPPRIQHRAAGLPRIEPAAPTAPPPAPAEPALANLDTHRNEPTTRRRLGSSAAGALDRLGVAGGAHRRDASPTAEIPAQGSPVDEPGPGDSR
ncbi:hypothetical protein FHX44_114110 [Pseudonocardia hierapolitana]|uniref:Uncharacterized protein n=1 Tax=Pseudonocardia hierapolitana TaxID=1128676 RepID=A0A561STM7_9PSEU|nr:hypothetical protein [Pseudonocardia hierapolitana]TWF78191.1 hypothetical protein FHX44_114110 [Pseudonocardia hierapolitana]